MNPHMRRRAGPRNPAGGLDPPKTARAGDLAAMGAASPSAGAGRTRRGMRWSGSFHCFGPARMNTPLALPTLRPEAPQERLSRILRRLASRPEAEISMAQLVLVFGDRAFGAIMLIFGLLTTLALIPGSSALTATPIVLVAGQLALGRRVLWLPRGIARRTIRTDDLRRFIDQALPYIRRAERIMAPRLGFIFGPVGDRLIGAFCLALGIVIFLPIPLGNFLPGIAVACLALALLRHDGLAAILGFLVALAGFALLIVVYGAAILAVRHVWTDLFHW